MSSQLTDPGRASADQISSTSLDLRKNASAVDPTVMPCHRNYASNRGESLGISHFAPWIVLAANQRRSIDLLSRHGDSPVDVDVDVAEAAKHGATLQESIRNPSNGFARSAILVQDASDRSITLHRPTSDEPIILRVNRIHNHPGPDR